MRGWRQAAARAWLTDWRYIRAARQLGSHGTMVPVATWSASPRFVAPLGLLCRLKRLLRSSAQASVPG